LLRRFPIICPACEADLTHDTSLFGLVRHCSSKCPTCGARVLYDTAGGVYLHEPKDRESDPESSGTSGARQQAD